MKQGQKPAEPRMEDVLASIRRAIDENAAGTPGDRLGGAMAELRVKLDAPQENRARRDFDHSSPSGSNQGFAGILGTRRGVESHRTQQEPVQRQSEPEIPPDEGQNLYNGYYGAQVADYVETPVEAYQASPPARTPARYVPLAPVPDHRSRLGAEQGLLSERSSEATQAAFDQLAETITRRALGERPIADIAHELLRGMLKQWLDDNLPKIVERLVREEIERVVRRPQR